MAPTFTLPLISILLFQLLLCPTLTSRLGPKLVKRPSSQSGSEVGQQTSSGASDFDTSSGDSSELLEPQDPICSPSFGVFPNPEPCWLARTQIPHLARDFATPFQFGPAGSAGTDVVTPKYFGRDQCVITISNSPDINTPDDGLWQAIYVAATAIIQQCVVGSRVGGHIAGEGFNGNIGVSIVSRQPLEKQVTSLTAAELNDRIRTGIQNPQPGSSSGQQQQQQDTGTSEERPAKKQKTCQAGESGYVQDAEGCCSGFAFKAQTFKDAAVQFGSKIGQAILEGGVCLLDLKQG